MFITYMYVKDIVGWVGFVQSDGLVDYVRLEEIAFLICSSLKKK